MAATGHSAWGRRAASLGLGIVLSAALLPSAIAAETQKIDFDPALQFVDETIRHWISDPVIIEAVKAQNANHLLLTSSDIEGLDREWVKQINNTYRPMLDASLETPLSRFLKAKEEEAGGAITELIVMDAYGLNVGESEPTSDYWQGDEDKFTRTFPRGPRAVFVDAPRMDESTHLMQSQVSLTLVDEHGHPIGAITIGINLDQL